MQSENMDGSKGMIEMFNKRKLFTHLNNPKVKEVHVFNLRPGMEVEMKGKHFEVLSLNSKGKKATLHLCRI